MPVTACIMVLYRYGYEWRHDSPRTHHAFRRPHGATYHRISRLGAKEERVSPRNPTVLLWSLPLIRKAPLHETTFSVASLITNSFARPQLQQNRARSNLAQTIR